MFRFVQLAVLISSFVCISAVPLGIVLSAPVAEPVSADGLTTSSVLPVEEDAPAENEDIYEVNLTSETLSSNNTDPITSVKRDIGEKDTRHRSGNHFENIHHPSIMGDPRSHPKNSTINAHNVTTSIVHNITASMPTTHKNSSATTTNKSKTTTKSSAHTPPKDKIHNATSTKTTSRTITTPKPAVSHSANATKIAPAGGNHNKTTNPTIPHTTIRPAPKSKTTSGSVATHSTKAAIGNHIKADNSTPSGITGRALNSPNSDATLVRKAPNVGVQVRTMNATDVSAPQELDSTTNQSFPRRKSAWAEVKEGNSHGEPQNLHQNSSVPLQSGKPENGTKHLTSSAKKDIKKKVSLWHRVKQTADALNVTHCPNLEDFVSGSHNAKEEFHDADNFKEDIASVIDTAEKSIVAVNHCITRMFKELQLAVKLRHTTTDALLNKHSKLSQV